MAKSGGKEFLTFCRVSSRCESMSPASFGAEIPCDPRLPLFSPFRALFVFVIRDGTKSGCNLSEFGTAREAEGMCLNDFDRFVASLAGCDR